MLKNQVLSESLSQSIVNIEEKSRSNLFTWRGQFSPQLIEALLIAYAKDGDRVFDPFLGSGTVLYEAGLLGLSASGCEINPAAVSFAKVYELIGEPIKTRSKSLAQIEEFVKQYTTDLPLQPTREILNFESDLLAYHASCRDKTTKIILNAFVVGLDFESKKTDLKRILSVWGVLRSNIESFSSTNTKLKCFEADARKSPLETDSVDFVITSPPYINVFNYHQNYRKSVEILGVDVLEVAKSEIGSNRKFRGNRFLTVVQYCMDMSQVFEELKRVCTRDAKIIFIVGRESNVRKTPFYNSDLLVKVAQACGLKLEGKQPRVFGNKFGVAIYEDILRFSIESKELNTAAIDTARAIGIKGLKAALKIAPDDVIAELEDAVQKAKQIQPSPFLGE